MEKARIKNYDFIYGQFLIILFICNKIFSFYGGKKKHIFLEENTISLVESHVSKILIPNDFERSGDEGLQTILLVQWFLNFNERAILGSKRI